MSDYAGREEILTEMVKVLTLAVGYAKVKVLSVTLRSHRRRQRPLC